MKRSISIGLLCAACYLAGLLTSQHVAAMGAMGQTSAQPTSGVRALSPPVNIVNGQALYYSLNDVKRRFSTEKGLTMTHLAFDPQYRLSVVTRPYYEPPRTTAAKVTSHWDDAEMHENGTHVIVMVQGTGTWALGGEPENQIPATGTTHRAVSLKGARMQRVVPGDWVVIPATTWHQTQPDPGQMMLYGMCHFENSSAAR